MRPDAAAAAALPPILEALAGLSEQEARERLQRVGPNELQRRRRDGWRAVLASVFAEPMFLLLLVAAALYLLLGDLGEGLLLAFFALVSVGLVVVQERRSERALEALRALAAPHVRVRRGGQTMRVPARELVPGDILLLSEGERIPADAVLREASALVVDESLLTGESVPVRKTTLPARAAVPISAPGGEDSPRVYAGTLVVGGHASAEVCATGALTQMGRIGASLADIEMLATPLQQHMKRLVRWFGLVAVLLSAALVLWYALSRGEWLQGLLAGLAFSMAMLPEEIPMVLTVFLGIGAWRLTRVRVLARRPAVIEALGGATVLCVDKTGTLTENRMRLRRLVTATADVDVAGAGGLPEDVHVLLEYAMLASRRGGIDPMDLALLARGDAALAATEHLHADWLLEQEYPLTPALLAMSQSWTRPDGGREVAAKGAPEAVADLCHLDADETARLLAQVRALAEDGLRVLAVAKGEHPDGDAALHQHDYRYTLLGLLAFEDPLRPGVPAAVEQARRAGIAVAMITGDHAATALAVARAAGIATEAGALTGEQIATMDEATLAQALQRVRVFARVLPEHKLRLVQAFQANGETVAMTGDGVNDAPALKAAHIGIAMGVRGTDVAREAASLVLLDENFTHVVEGVRLGRRIFANLRRAMSYITAIHVPIAGIALLPALFGWPPIVLPAHVVLTEMVVDPVCAFAFEAVPEDPRAMQRPPRAAREMLLGRATLRAGLVQGVVLLAVVLACWSVARSLGAAEDEARTLAIVALTAGNLALVWANTASASGRGAAGQVLAGVALFAVSALGLAIWLPAGRELLRFAPAPPAALALAAASAVAAVLSSATFVGKQAADPPGGRMAGQGGAGRLS